MFQLMYYIAFQVIMYEKNKNKVDGLVQYCSN